MSLEEIYKDYLKYLNEALENGYSSEWAFNKIKGTHGINVAKVSKVRYVKFLKQNPEEYQKLKMRAEKIKSEKQKKSINKSQTEEEYKTIKLPVKKKKSKTTKKPIKKSQTEIENEIRRRRRSNTRWSDPRDFKGVIK